MSYNFLPTPTDTINVLVEVARHAAVGAKAEHPDDIAIAMITAIEYAAETIELLGKSNLLKGQP